MGREFSPSRSRKVHVPLGKSSKSTLQSGMVVAADHIIWGHMLSGRMLPLGFHATCWHVILSYIGTDIGFLMISRSSCGTSPNSHISNSNFEDGRKDRRADSSWWPETTERFIGTLKASSSVSPHMARKYLGEVSHLAWEKRCYQDNKFLHYKFETLITKHLVCNFH